ncbi:GNAT family N-acetyltransferase [Oligoflexia bacterium]|nr:GNAT family N-acetyltransferase [Oligoflexia bacterium]
MEPVFEIRQISAEEARPIRQQVLYPGDPESKSLYRGDTRSEARHFGAFDSNCLIGAVSVYLRDPKTDKPLGRSWRIRGNAILDKEQGRGIGRELVNSCVRYVESQAGELIWCDVRTNVTGFYESLGFHVEGEPFYLEGMGMRYRMTRKI